MSKVERSGETPEAFRSEHAKSEKTEPEEEAELEAASSIERIMYSEREAFTSVGAAPELKVPDTAELVIRFDMAKLIKHIPFYRESIWDEYLEGVAKQAAEARSESLKQDEASAALRDRVLEEAFEREAYWAADAVETMINLSILAALFNPLHPELRVNRMASDLLMATEMNRTVVLFLDDKERMQHLRAAMSKHVEQMCPDASADERASMLTSLYLHQRVAMAFTGLVTYQAVLSHGKNWALDAKAILTGSFDGVGERLQQIFAEDYVQLLELMSEEQLSEWLGHSVALIRPRATAGMNSLYTFLENRAQKQENPPFPA